MMTSPPTPSRRSTPTTSSRSTASAEQPDRTAHKPLKPFTVDHFRRYAGLMVLDNGDEWRAEDFQLEIARDLFAGFSEVWVVIPEGNAKTTLMSGLALYHGDYTPTAEVLLAASSRDQAGLLFGQAAGFVERSPGFSQRFRVFEGYRRIKCLRSSGRLQVFAADDRTGDGVIPTLALADEAHRHRDMRLVRTWIGKLLKRGGQFVGISTAGEPGTEFEDTRARLLANATDIRREDFHARAVVGEAVLHDWSVPQSADVEDMTVVKRSNPLAAITEADLAKKRRSPAMTLQHWRRFVCNQAVRTQDSAIDPKEWAAAGTDEPIPVGERVWIGADFGWKHDTTALVPLWMPDAERCMFGTPKILTPPRDGTNLSPREVKRAFEEIHERNPIEVVVMDPDRAAEIAEWLEQELGVTVAEYSQSNEPMALAYDRFMEALRNGRLSQPRDEEFTEHALNAVAKLLPDGRARFDRPSTTRAQAGQRRRVIDALIAAAIVLSSAVADKMTSIYEQRGLLAV